MGQLINSTADGYPLWTSLNTLLLFPLRLGMKILFRKPVEGLRNKIIELHDFTRTHVPRYPPIDRPPYEGRPSAAQEN